MLPGLQLQEVAEVQRDGGRARSGGASAGRWTPARRACHCVRGAREGPARRAARLPRRLSPRWQERGRAPITT
eukprot:5073241-Pyramimonas_sp.AAC.1